MDLRTLLTILFLTTLSGLIAQQRVSGTILDQEGEPVSRANITVPGLQTGAVTDNSGEFSLMVAFEDSIILRISHIAFVTREITVKSGNSSGLVIRLEPSDILLSPIEIEAPTRNGNTSLFYVSGSSMLSTPSASGDISAILRSLPGVIANNELSTAYSVRGGNFDENLVFINDIPVYRPFLIANGRQEGLSFINPNLLENLEFHTGGWHARYGGKVSSVLSARYRTPDRNSISISAGLLGADISSDLVMGKWKVLLGARYKTTRYLLNTFDVEGEYLPRFADVQTLISYELSDRTTLEGFLNYSRNRYEVIPQARLTEFGTFNRSFRLYVAFDGKEMMNYDTWQTALRVSHRLNDEWRIRAVVSAVKTAETEYTELEGGYRLCDVDRNAADSEDCLLTRGIGSNYDYRRNRLGAELLDARLINIHNVNDAVELEWGIEVQRVDIDDRLSEFSFIDSADYVTGISNINSDNSLIYTNSSAYASLNGRTGRLQYRAGLRAILPGATEELLWSPRFSMIYALTEKMNLSGQIGMYHQIPFYRELRNRVGDIAADLHSQSSWQAGIGLERNMEIWGRPFEWTSEVYHKQLWNVNPYDIENVRIRYYAQNIARARVSGLDMRMGGEFIAGTESWFSLGILSAREELEEDGRPWLRRPSDQRVTFGLVFQDHWPNNPSMRVSVNLQVGTGLPFGPPENPAYRNVFTMRAYRRLDMGFSKEFDWDKSRLLITAEVLNLIGAENVITYSWIEDIVDQQIAVPNTLSNRFFNLKLRYSL